MVGPGGVQQLARGRAGVVSSGCSRSGAQQGDRVRVERDGDGRAADAVRPCVRSAAIEGGVAAVDAVEIADRDRPAASRLPGAGPPRSTVAIALSVRWAVPPVAGRGLAMRGMMVQIVRPAGRQRGERRTGPREAEFAVGRSSLPPGEESPGSTGHGGG